LKTQAKQIPATYRRHYGLGNITMITSFEVGPINEEASPCRA
jgi:hypothetical protein